MLALHAAALAFALVAAMPPARAAEGPRPLDLEAYMHGKRIFESQCMPCHGRNGRGDGEWAGVPKDRPRDLTKGIFKFRTTPMGALPTEADLMRTIRSGVSGTMMPTFAQLNERDLRSLVAYVRGFSSRWDDPKAYAEPIELPEPPTWLTDPVVAEHQRNGAALFAQTCAACHGPSAKGDGAAGKELRDVWGHAIVPADLTNPHHKSGDRPVDLYRTISMGLDGTPMVGFLAALGPEKIWDLVAFILSRQQSPSADSSADRKPPASSPSSG